MYFNLKMEYNHNECHCNCKKYHMCKKDYNWNPSTCICENSRYLKSIVDESVIVCITDGVSTSVTNSVSTNVTRTKSINCDDKKIRYRMDCYILHTYLLVTIILFMIAIISYHYAKHKSKQKNMGLIIMVNRE